MKTKPLKKERMNQWEPQRERLAARVEVLAIHRWPSNVWVVLTEMLTWKDSNQALSFPREATRRSKKRSNKNILIKASRKMILPLCQWMSVVSTMKRMRRARQYLIWALESTLDPAWTSLICSSKRHVIYPRLVQKSVVEIQSTPSSTKRTCARTYRPRAKIDLWWLLHFKINSETINPKSLGKTITQTTISL